MLPPPQPQTKFRPSQNLAAICGCNRSEDLTASCPVCPPSHISTRCLRAAPILGTRPPPLLTRSGRRPETEKRPFRRRTCELSCSALPLSLTQPDARWNVSFRHCCECVLVGRKRWAAGRMPAGCRTDPLGKSARSPACPARANRRQRTEAAARRPLP